MNGHGSDYGERKGYGTSTDKNQQRTTLQNAMKASTGKKRVGQAAIGSVKRKPMRRGLHKNTAEMHRLQQTQEESRPQGVLIDRGVFAQHKGVIHRADLESHASL